MRRICGAAMGNSDASKDAETAALYGHVFDNEGQEEGQRQMSVKESGAGVSAQGEVMSAELKDEQRTPCEVWSRVMGYHRPTSSWNTGKQQEWQDRRHFSESKTAKPLIFKNSIV